LRAHFFDMDGTLLRGTSAPLLVAAALGKRDVLVSLEERFAAGALTAADFGRTLHAEWGLVPPAAARAAFDTAPLLTNIEAVVGDIHERGERACLITMSPDYFAEHFLDFGFDAVFASRFPRNAETPFEAAHILNPGDKPRLAAEFCRDHGLRIEEAVAYGDSMTDVPLFETVGFRISVNGDHHLHGRCDVEIRSGDLQEAYAAARAWCDALSDTPRPATS
jgi:phosphoserine phosphatase